MGLSFIVVRTLGRGATSLALVGAACLLAAGTALAQPKTLKFIPEADLRILDPIVTTAYITRNHSYMVYDVLFAVDEKFQVQPQMVDKYELSPDKLTWTFTLRDGLKFHDGAPVKSADCIASIQRWAKRDVFGQKLAEMTDSWTAVNDKTFRLKLKQPFPYVLDALAKPSSNVPFIMPERVARPTRPPRSPRRSARARSASSRKSGCPATRSCTSRTRITCRARSRRRGAPAARW